MGEAFTDVDIKSGFYRELMMRQYETIFSIEPMKTYKDYFNVHIVYAVAPKTYVSEDPLKSAFHTEYVSYNSGVRVAVGDIYYGETRKFSPARIEYISPGAWSTYVSPWEQLWDSGDEGNKKVRVPIASNWNSI